MTVKTVTAIVPGPLVDKLDAIAARTLIPRDRVIEQALDSWVERAERDRTRTLQGLADVDDGRLVDDDAVAAWAAALGTT